MNRILYQTVVLTMFAILPAYPSFSQPEPVPFKARQSVYVELAGTNQLYSINYDRIIGASAKSWLFGYRIGGSLAGRQLVRSRVIGEVYTLLGQQKHHLELGLSSSIGRNWTYTQTPYAGSVNIQFAPVVAYRLQEASGPSCFRFSVSPAVVENEQENSGLSLYVGIGYGRSF